LRSGRRAACPAGDDQPAVAEVDVAEVQLPDGLGPGGVDGGQGDREAGGGRDGGGGGLVHLGGLQRLDEDQGTLAVADAAGGSRKIVPVFLAWPNSDRRTVRAWRRRLGGRSSVAAMMSAAVA
jgi:hypothetical protein